MPLLQCISLRTLLPAELPAKTVLCLGNFDGVHIAHKELIRSAKELCEGAYPDAVCAVFCFREPSWLFLQKEPQKQLCTLTQKLRAFAEAGADLAVLCDFPAVMHLSPDDFIQAVLKEQAHAIAAVCGFNYRFGKNGAGNADLLRAHFGNAVLVKEEVLANGACVSSTRIRELLESGKPEAAAHLLGRPFSLTSPVIHGKALGQKLGSPTVNQQFPHGLLIPRHGVYVTRCRISEKLFYGVTNVGLRPTVDQSSTANCETYLLNFSGDLYGTEIEVSFLKFLRPEQKFATKEKLALQIQADIATAKAYAETEGLA